MIKCPFNDDCKDIVKSEDVNFDFYCNDCGSLFEDESKYKSGTFIMGRCTIVITKPNNFWQLIIYCKDSYPSFKEVAKAKYRYLPDHVIMAQIFPLKKEFDRLPENAHVLIQLHK